MLREAGLRVEGLCAFGLLKGEAGLHQWIARDFDNKHSEFPCDLYYMDLLRRSVELKPEESRFHAALARARDQHGAGTEPISR